MGDYLKPVPVSDPDSAPFWAGCCEHRLMVQKCAACGAFRYPPGPFCPHCRSHRAEWIRSAGRGKVFSWIVVTHPVPKDVYAGDVPYVVALVELDEGVRMASNIVGCAPSDVRGDMRVEVLFDDVAPGITLPRFKPAGTPTR
jgi:uncharacterized OB-fold protein